MIQHFHVPVSHRQYCRHMTHLFEQQMPQVYSENCINDKITNESSASNSMKNKYDEYRRRKRTDQYRWEENKCENSKLKICEMHITSMSHVLTWIIRIFRQCKRTHTKCDVHNKNHTINSNAIILHRERERNAVATQSFHHELQKKSV